MKKNNKQFLSCAGLTILWFFSALSYASNQVQSIRIWPSPDNTRVVLDLSAAPEYKSFSLDKPDRLVIDLTNTNGSAALPAINGESKLIKAIRSSGDNNSMRIVLDLTNAVKPTVFALTPTAPYGHRLVIDLPDDNARLTREPPRSIRAARDIVIAIDAGHGGEDPGSIGPTGTYEKNLTLPIARRLAELIDKEPGMKSLLVRTGDYYVHINRRTDIARSMQADLLVSIHADAFTSPQPRGAAVWVLSLRRATTEVGRMLEQTERHGELLGGVAEVIRDSANERYLAQTVLDLSMNHSMVTAHQAANQVLTELAKITRLHKAQPQAASLGVLRSPDIPSILVEVGFISNPQEEQQLRNSSHQARLAQSLFTALKRHFQQAPPADSLFAQQRSREHKVQAGESLSLLAQRYDVSVDALRSHNKLANDSIRIGQVLRIP
ncbi:N-acetylmuramoyl-L-alanine amidase [Arsukibacterium ikkense]|uniref:N-acetylmuramoyl-L-alanine amidase n=2 Tax=Arsukibacterium ikkense TaxID=336831 RepID=A0A0M2V4F0_9GAMM|nr:N-acetylmuramoyl-L-alanine amidase [Arsukibacterium ikkense]